MPDWLEPTIVLLPYVAWMFLGVGIPWALAVLPRHLWRERVVVLAVGMALGPVLHTAWLFVLGTWFRIALASTLVGSGALAALGAALAARRWIVARRDARPAQPAGAAMLPPAPHPRPRAAIAIVAGIALLVLLNVVITAYWPFIAYDTQWVYGYNARIFVLEGRIPADTGYYPQLVPLSYTTLQQAWGALGHDGLFGAPVDDHAARVIVPWFNLASILMAYVLGLLVWRKRRVALLTAAVWAFYPHMNAWAGAGDLEITLTLYVTGAAAFFIAAWQAAGDRAASTPLAVVSGLLLGGALWTKPTGGALALGMMLAVFGALALQRMAPRAWWPYLRVALVAGAASAPIGGMWYLRNLLLGHPAVVFPADYWHDFAQRSGQELGWPLLLAALVAGGLVVRARDVAQTLPGSPRVRLGLARSLSVLGVALLLAGALPSALANVETRFDAWLWLRGDVSAGARMGWGVWALILAGAGLLAWSARGMWRQLPARQRETLLLIWALMLPYAVVWFLDFSYHYRLSFAIVPLAAVQVAVLIDGWLWDWLAARRVGQVAGMVLLAGVIALAGAAGVEHTASAWLDGGLPDDRAKYDAGNPALMVVVRALEQHAAEHGGSGPGGTPVVAIPGEDRLPFFFPTWDIRNSREPGDLPTHLEDLAGVDVFVNNSVAVFLLQQAGKWPNSLQADAEVGALYHTLDVRDAQGDPWPTVLEPIPLGPGGALPVDDGNFRYTAFTIHPQARRAPMQPNAPAEGRVLIGDVAQYVGHDMGNLNWQRGARVVLTLYWRPTAAAPPARDYSIYIHLLDPQGNLIAQWDGPPLQSAYPTRFWRPGESLLDYRKLTIPDDIPTGPAHVRIGIYDPISGERLPVTVDGEPAGDGVTIETRIQVQ